MWSITTLPEGIVFLFFQPRPDLCVKVQNLLINQTDLPENLFDDQHLIVTLVVLDCSSFSFDILRRNSLGDHIDACLQGDPTDHREPDSGALDPSRSGRDRTSLGGEGG